VGDYYGAVEQKVIRKHHQGALPQRRTNSGEELRLEQQYFFVACSLQDMIRMHLAGAAWIPSTKSLPSAQRHPPGVGVAELMRLLVDEYQAWSGMQPGRLPKDLCLHQPHPAARSPRKVADRPVWRLLPRHLEIIFEINQRFLDQVRMQLSPRRPNWSRVSLIDEGGERYVRMAQPGLCGQPRHQRGSGPAHQLLKQTMLKDFYELWPGKVQQQNQWGHPPPLDVAEQSPPGRPDFRAKSATAGFTPGRTAAARSFVDGGFRHYWRQIKQANKRTWPTYIQQPPALPSTPTPCSMCR
jgi:starch phosphorylase